MITSIFVNTKLFALGKYSNLPQDLRLALIAGAALIAFATAFASMVETPFQPTVIREFIWLAAYFFQVQDRPILIAIVLLLSALALVPLPERGGRAKAYAFFRPYGLLIMLAIVVLALGVIGGHLVFNDYHLSRDEDLAEFDSLVFRSGRLIAPIEEEWKPFASALEPRFMLPIHELGFVSAYLPVNAWLRAITGLIVGSSWTSPCLAAIAILMTYATARRLWPDRIDAARISTLLVATSSQVLVMSMTSYAMTAHLALNMTWLWFFLRGGKIGHGVAILIGFLAVGLHQIVFHPLFVTPFLLRLWYSKRQRLAVIYAASYIVICIFWIEYWKLISTWVGASSQASENVGTIYFVARVYLLLANFGWDGADFMIKNLLRFVAWQNPIVLPLAFLSYTAIRKDFGIARELMTGILLTILAMFILLPCQGHGWGYRYLHGLIGNVALLGGYGWIALSDRITEEQLRSSRAVVAICSLTALLILLPVHAIQAHRFVSPYEKAWAAINQSSADVVIVDKSRLLLAEDLVRNDPYLRNRPKVLDLTNLNEDKIKYLCQNYRIAIFGFDQAVQSGIHAVNDATKDDDAVRLDNRKILSQYRCDLNPIEPIETVSYP